MWSWACLQKRKTNSSTSAKHHRCEKVIGNIPAPMCFRLSNNINLPYGGRKVYLNSYSNSVQSKCPWAMTCSRLISPAWIRELLEVQIQPLSFSARETPHWSQFGKYLTCCGNNTTDSLSNSDFTTCYMFNLPHCIWTQSECDSLLIKFHFLIKLLCKRKSAWSYYVIKLT